MAFEVNHEYSKRFSEEVAKQLRSLKGTPQGESMNQGGPYLGSGVKRAGWTSRTLASRTPVQMW